MRYTFTTRPSRLHFLLSLVVILVGAVGFATTAWTQELGLERLVNAAPADLPGSVALNSQQPLRAFPAGDQIGTLFPKAKIIRGEERSDWVKVTVEGWVSKKAFEDLPAPVVQAVPQGAVSIVDFTVERISRRTIGGDRDVVKLILRVKNNSANLISAWEGFLLARLATGHQLFSIPISSENKPIPAGGFAELSFVWKEGEDRFSDLDGRTKDDMNLVLSAVQVQH